MCFFHLAGVEGKLTRSISMSLKSCISCLFPFLLLQDLERAYPNYEGITIKSGRRRLMSGSVHMANIRCNLILASKALMGVDNCCYFLNYILDWLDLTAYFATRGRIIVF